MKFINAKSSKEALDAIAGTNKRIVCYDDKMQWIFDVKIRFFIFHRVYHL